MTRRDHWRRDEPQFFDVFSLPHEPIGEPALLHRVEGCLLSRDAASGSATFLVHIAPGWARAEDAEEATVELFVLSGDLTVNGDRVGAGGYVFVPQSSGTSALSSERGALAFCFWNPDLPLFPSHAEVSARRTWQEPWEASSWPGAVHGLWHKSLRVPDFAGDMHGGPGGLLRLALVGGGYLDGREQVHHECWEEIFTLRGDMFLAERGVMGLGTCLANPQEFWHAPLYSQTGCLMLFHTDAPMGPWEFRCYPAGEELGAHYLDTASFARLPEHRELGTLPDLERWRSSPEYAAWRSGPDSAPWASVDGRRPAGAFRAEQARMRRA
jgi:hypothetical protein